MSYANLIITVVILTFSNISFANSCKNPSSLFNQISKVARGEGVDRDTRAVETFHNSSSKKMYVRPKTVFKKMADLISRAESNVQYQVWRFAPEVETSDIIADGIKRLTARLKKENRKTPVDFWLSVNILRYQNKRREVKKLKAYIEKHKLNNKYVKLHLGFYQAKLLGVNHAKSLTVDGGYALVTGANSSKKNNGVGLYDLGYVFSGKIVREISKDFVKFWQEHTDSRETPPIATLPKLQKKSCLPILFTKSKAYNPLDTDIQDSSLNFAFLAAVGQAKKSIDIISPNINVNAFEEELLLALNSGVKVRMVLSKLFEFNGENFPTRGGANIFTVQKLYRKLKRTQGAKKACALLDIRWYSEDGLKASEGSDSANSHAKYMSVDGQVTYVGSANLDNQSWVNSKEIGLFVDSRTLTHSWKKQGFLPAFKRAVKVSECDF